MNPLTHIASLSVRLKLQIAGVAIVLLLVGVGLYVVNQYDQLSQPIADVLAESIGQERTQSMTAVIDTVTLDTQAIATDGSLTDVYTALAADPKDQTAHDKLMAAFEDTLNRRPLFRRIRFVASNGTILASAPASTGTDDRGQDYFRALQGQAPTNNIYVSNLRRLPVPTIDFVTSPGTKDKPLGYVVVTFDPSASADAAQINLMDMLRPANYRTGTLQFYLVNADGSTVAVANSTNQSGFDIGDIQKFYASGSSTPGVRQYISPLTGKLTTGYVAPIGNMRAVLVTESAVISINNNNDVGQPIAQLAIVIALIILIVLGIGAMLDAAVVGPLRRTLRTAQNMVAGRNLTDLSALPQQDEIGKTYGALLTLNQEAARSIQVLEQRIQERTRDLEAASEISASISVIRDLDQLLNQVVELIRQRFPSIYHSQVFLLDPSKKFAVLRVSTGEAGLKLLARGHRLGVGSQSVIGRVTAGDEPVVALDTSTSSIHRANELLPDTRAELALPLHTDEGVIGALDLQSKIVDAFTEADIRVFQHVADQLAVAIVNARLFEESQSRLQEIETLNRQLLGTAWQRFSESHRRLASGTDSAPEEWTPLQLEAARKGELVQQLNENSVTIALPVLLRGVTIGAVEWDIPRENYGEDTRALARELAARLAITADNARLFEQQQRQAERERLVNDISAKLTQQSEVSQILQMAVKELGQALHVPQTTIRLARNQES